ncbi:(2Fe-2S)-binding protein [Actinomadura madurae]|uniref:(2Fe-2S)-binding protein n=1 Tax=Actinomadura madurae TaxID=1993 RepID=UPI003557E6AA
MWRWCVSCSDGGRSPVRGVRGGGFVRNNCCLYYRVPGGGMCGDCGLARNVR